MSATPRHANESAQRQTRAVRHERGRMSQGAALRARRGSREPHRRIPRPGNHMELVDFKTDWDDDIFFLPLSSFLKQSVCKSSPVPHSPLDAWSR